MKIAVSSDGSKLDDKVSEFFGRANYILIIETNKSEVKLLKAIENASKDQRGGAGIACAEKIASENAEVVITGNLGPRAMDALKQFGIKSYKGQGTVKESVKLLGEGKLQIIG